jgi:hypothetical protein
MPVISSTFPCPATAAVVAHAVDDVADRHGAFRGVRLVDHLHLAAAIALDAQEPRREGAASGSPMASAAGGSESLP